MHAYTCIDFNVTQFLYLSPTFPLFHASNRAAAFLHLVKLNKALADADTTIALDPNWEKVSNNIILNHLILNKVYLLEVIGFSVSYLWVGLCMAVRSLQLGSHEFKLRKGPLCLQR